MSLVINRLRGSVLLLFVATIVLLVVSVMWLPTDEVEANSVVYSDYGSLKFEDLAYIRTDEEPIVYREKEDGTPDHDFMKQQIELTNTTFLASDEYNLEEKKLWLASAVRGCRIAFNTIADETECMRGLIDDYYLPNGIDDSYVKAIIKSINSGDS